MTTLMKALKKSGIGTRIKQLRIDKGLTATEIAEAIGVTPSTYREWENGRSIQGEPYPELAKIFQVTLVELMTGEKLEASDIFAEFGELEDRFIKFKEALYSSF